MQIDCSFPGGNIIVERVEEHDVWLHQDLRDTVGDWFYWCFRVTGTPGRRVRFHFTRSHAIGARGPAVSEDGGKTWRWLGVDYVSGNSFAYTFPDAIGQVFFGVTIPYTGADWQRFLRQPGRTEFWHEEVLCLTHRQRPVEMFRAGCLQQAPRHRVLLTARHHCCETMASFVLEGLLAFVVANGEGEWLRQNVEFFAVPFMDREGVEAGDQGKNRRPHDHNRDYGEPSSYVETAALKALVSRWPDGLLRAALDLIAPPTICPSARHGTRRTTSAKANGAPGGCPAMRPLPVPLKFPTPMRGAQQSPRTRRGSSAPTWPAPSASGCAGDDAFAKDREVIFVMISANGASNETPAGVA